jgi:predicted ester cyclase
VSIVEYTFSGTDCGELEGIPATGRWILVGACSVVEVRVGRIHRERDYYDTLALMEQLGVGGNR